MCNGPVWISSRDNIVIEGDATGSRDDGIILPAGLVENPYGAIGIWDSASVSLDNLTLSAENYVSQKLQLW